jgi:hypothetical protein
VRTKGFDAPRERAQAYDAPYSTRTQSPFTPEQVFHQAPDADWLPDHDAPPMAQNSDVPRTLRAEAIANWVGAALSIALIIGVSVWGYRLMMRDVTGVPVVRALEGPMRIAPDDPGGRQAAYLGLAVNEVAADGVAAAAPERVVLAPPPLSLDAPFPEAATRGLVDVSAPADTAALSPAQDDAARNASGAPLRSPIPRPRPAGDLLAEAAVNSVVAAMTGGTDAAPAEIDPATLAAGTRLVQLGAYDTREDAAAEWDRLTIRFGALMDGRARVVQAAESGGEAFYRLRAHGFADENDARQFCAALLAEQAACIPVLIR